MKTKTGNTSSATRAESFSKAEELDHIYELAPVGLALLDDELRFLRCNQRFADIDGSSIEEHLGRTLREVFPDAADEVEPIFRYVLETGEPSRNNQIRTVVPSEPGRQRWLLASYYPSKSDGGHVVGVSVVVEDITELKASEAMLRKSDELLRGFTEHSPAVMYIKDSENKHVYGNRMILDLLGLSMDEFVGTSSHDVFPAEIAQNIEAADKLVRSNQSPHEVPLERMERDGKEMFFKEVKFPIESTSGERLVAGVGEIVKFCG